MPKIAHNRKHDTVRELCSQSRRIAPPADRVEISRPSIGERLLVAVPCRAHPCLVGIVAVDHPYVQPSMCHARWPVAVLRVDTALARHLLSLYCRVVLRGLIARGHL